MTRLRTLLSRGMMLCGLCVCSATLVAVAAEDNPGSAASSGLFATRIQPLATAPDGSSCADCHFSGVAISNYIGKDEVSTFASLRDAGLIDVQHPEQSRLLTFIGRRPEQPNVLTERVRSQELAAFQEWIQGSG